MFVLAVADRAARTVPVTVSCIRAPSAAVTGQEYTCKTWAIGWRRPLMVREPRVGGDGEGCRSEANQVETIWSVDKDDASASCSPLAWASVHNA